MPGQGAVQGPSWDTSRVSWLLWKLRPADQQITAAAAATQLSAGIVTLSPGESACELPQLAPVRVGVAVRAADRAPAALLRPALAAADRQLQLLQAVVHRVQLLSALPGPGP